MTPGDHFSATEAFVECGRQWFYERFDSLRDMRPIVNALVARLDYDRVIIKQDRHGKPLAKALEARGVSPSQIALAYHQGETV